MPRDDERCEVLIGGAGFAGLALAIALKEALGASFAVTVADPTLGRRPADNGRATAIVAAARRLFETLGVWQRIADEAQPILDMHITDSRLGDAMRPVFLHFDGDVVEGEPFAHMVENAPLLAALLDKARELDVTLLPVAVANFDLPKPEPRVEISLADGTRQTARVLVAADGARSRIRERAGIITRGWDYAQSSIVATVAHERDHGGRAEEHFLPAGPFAILP